MSRLDFDCDRQSKRDFTASTTTYFKENGCSLPIRWWELTSANTLTPFDSGLAYEQAVVDLFMSIGGVVLYAFELKERNMCSDNHWLIDEGSFVNEEKLRVMDGILNVSGFTPIWVELYDDDEIRIWNLSKIDIWDLPKKVTGIKKINIDPYSRKRTQVRRLLAVSASTMYRREKG